MIKSGQVFIHKKTGARVQALSDARTHWDAIELLHFKSGRKTRKHYNYFINEYMLAPENKMIAIHIGDRIITTKQPPVDIKIWKVIKNWLRENYINIEEIVE